MTQCKSTPDIFKKPESEWDCYDFSDVTLLNYLQNTKFLYKEYGYSFPIPKHLIEKYDEVSYLSIVDGTLYAYSSNVRTNLEEALKELKVDQFLGDMLLDLYDGAIGRENKDSMARYEEFVKEIKNPRFFPIQFLEGCIRCAHEFLVIRANQKRIAIYQLRKFIFESSLTSQHEAVEFPIPMNVITYFNNISLEENEDHDFEDGCAGGLIGQLEKTLKYIKLNPYLAFLLKLLCNMYDRDQVRENTKFQRNVGRYLKNPKLFVKAFIKGVIKELSNFK